MSRQLEDFQEEKRDREIAEQLGITYDELGETNWSIEERVGNDDFVYGHYIKFSEDSPAEILAKISGLENNCVDIQFREEPEDEDFDPTDDGADLLTANERLLADQLLPQLAQEARRKRDNENQKSEDLNF